MKNNKGFTLIELIVVIVILGILAVNAAPKFIDLQKDARIALLQGAKGAIESANEMIHGYAVIHGLENFSLRGTQEDGNKDKGKSHTTAMVKFIGNNIVKTNNDSNKESVFFLDYGYIAVTYGDGRDSGLAQALGRNTIAQNGNVKTVHNLKASSDTVAKQLKCAPPENNIDFCYVSPQSPQWKLAYLILNGFTAEQCALKYEAATKANTPPTITLITTGC